MPIRYERDDASRRVVVTIDVASDERPAQVFGRTPQRVRWILVALLIANAKRTDRLPTVPGSPSRREAVRADVRTSRDVRPVVEPTLDLGESIERVHQPRAWLRMFEAVECGVTNPPP
jgi:hypothetical protein